MLPIMAGNIYLADLPISGNQQGGRRPVVVTQNNKGNAFGPRVHVVPLTARVDKARHMPTHVVVQPSEQNGLNYPSVALAENLQSVQKSEFIMCLGTMERDSFEKVGQAIRVHLGI